MTLELIHVENVISRLPRRKKTPEVVDYASWIGTGNHHTKGRGDPIQIARAHVLARGWATVAYPFIDHDGVMHQCLSLEEPGIHAGADHNTSRIGIALTGNYDIAEPHPDALYRMAWLHAHLSLWLQWPDPSAIVGEPGYESFCQAGHHELPWGSSKVDASGKVLKSCPGSNFIMPALRTITLSLLLRLDGMDSLDAERALRAAGVSI